MAHEGLLVGELARRAGTTRKALRLYEAAGLLPPARRTPAGYRVYTHEALPLLAFILKARRIGFSVAEIKMIVGIKRSGQAPCRHVHDLVRRKAADVERTLTELTEMRKALRRLLGSTARNHVRRQGTMDTKSKTSLCPSCKACPEVEIVGDEVRIGEEGNLAVLKAAEWNVLVNLIQSGQLTTI